MTKQELTRKLAEETGMPLSTTKMFLESFRDVITELVINKEEIDFYSLFRINYVSYKERLVRNPRTNEKILAPAKTTAKIKLSKKITNQIKH